MKAELIAHDGEELTIQVKVKITGSLFEAEHTILDACNDLGQWATLHALKRFDTDGSPIQVGSIKFTAKGTPPKFYETPSGAVEVSRNVYQTSQGGKVYCPLEFNARIIQNAPPRFVPRDHP